ncbi:MAG: hypothetical protein NC394_06210 [Bacteroides sp.]|nr:hypothetical protein [Bacteroides sp.]
MKKQIEISKLMDDYADDEFDLGAESAADEKAVRSRVMARVKPKRSIKFGTKTVLIAAAIAVSVLTAAVLPYGIIRGQNGTRFEFYETGLVDIKYPEAKSEVVPYAVENDRIYFTANDQRIDITDIVESGENYYYKYTSEDTNGKEYVCIVAIGGSAENIMYGEMIIEPKAHGQSAAYFSEDFEPFCYFKNGEIISVDTPEKRAECTHYPYRSINDPHYIAFSYQYSLWYDDITAGREIDVSKAISTSSFESEYTDWVYPEDWTGERVEEE